MLTFITSNSKLTFLRLAVQQHERKVAAVRQVLPCTRFRNFRSFSSTIDISLKDAYEYVLVEKKSGQDTGDGVGLITLNRPKALNALCDDLFSVSTIYVLYFFATNAFSNKCLTRFFLCSHRI